MFQWLRERLGFTRPDPVEAKLADLRKQIQVKLHESVLNYYDSLVDPREPLYDSTDFWLPLGYSENLPTNLDNRKKGEVLPIYLTEYGLKVIRDQSRKLCAFNEFAINALENRVSYIVGKGLQYQVVPRYAEGDRGEEAKQAAAQAQRVLDEFIEANDFGDIEQEAVRRNDRDGESFIRLFHVGDGECEVRFVEPEHVRSPGDQSAALSFGIQTDPEDIEKVEGFWVVENPAEVYEPSFVDASEIVHLKLNVDRNAKRGVPTFLPVRKNLDRADKLLRNMSTLAQIQSTYAVIRKHKNYSAAAIQTWQQNQADIAVTTPVTGLTKYMQQLLPGSIIDTSENTDYEFPSMEVAAEGLVGILQAELRAVASRLVMPEFMLTSDASNSNYASTLVAEAPSTRNFERLQAYYARKFGDGKYRRNRHCGVMWRVIRYAVEAGRLPDNVLDLVEIQAEGPNLVARDKGQETTRAATLSDKGILSKATWAKWEGLDYDQEQKQRATEPPTGGTPGGPDQPPNDGDSEPPEDDGTGLMPDFAESLLESGFSGEIKDKKGRRRCYQDGKEVPCPKAAGSGKQPAQAKPGKSTDSRGQLKSPSGHKAQHQSARDKATQAKTKAAHLARQNAGKQRATVGNDNEVRLAEALGPGHDRLPDSEPMDVVRRNKTGPDEGWEVKTLLTNATGQIHMAMDQRERKDKWAEGKLIGIRDKTPRDDPSYDPKRGRRVHVVVIDHREAWYEHVDNGADFHGRQLDSIYYARHPRPYHTKDMIHVDSVDKLKKLQALSDEEWARTYKEYKGHSWGSGKPAPQPEVHKIVNGETLAQVKQLHADRTAKLERAKDYGQRLDERSRDLKARADQLKKQARKLARRGVDPQQVRRARRRHFRAVSAYHRTEVAKVGAERAIALRQKKLAHTTATLASKFGVQV